MRKLSLNREDSTDIGFATTCLISSAITFDEVKDWLNEIIATMDDYPLWIFDILDLEKKFDYTLHVRRILGFQPSACLSDADRRAIAGIAYRRFPDHHSDLAPRETALTALAQHQEIEARFRDLFPAIVW